MQWTRRREERDILRRKLNAIDTADNNMEGLDQFMGVLCVNLLVIAMQLSEHTTKKVTKKLGTVSVNLIRLRWSYAIDPAHAALRMVSGSQRCAVKTMVAFEVP